MEATYCNTCGIEISDLQPARGRKRDYCGDQCKDVATFLHAASVRLLGGTTDGRNPQTFEAIEFATSDKVRHHARALFGLYNELHNRAQAMKRAEQASSHQEQYCLLGNWVTDAEAARMLKRAARLTENRSDKALRAKAREVKRNWRQIAARPTEADAFLTAAKVRE